MPKKKIALLFICLNKPYWPFLKDVFEDCKKHFLTNHEVDFYVWSDMPELNSPEFDAILAETQTQNEINDILKNDFKEFCALNPHIDIQNCLIQWNQRSLEKMDAVNRLISREKVKESIEFLRSQPNIHIIPTDSVPWPAPTLMRYHLFLNEEEKIKGYDYVFYLDCDMRVVDTIGEEILGEGITMAEHPMYSLRREYIPPYEPNRNSTAFIPRFGVLIQAPDSAPWFKPLYAAGGFQGGTSTAFITAMKDMKKNIDKDYVNNYVAIWNDESHWNKYLWGYTGHLIVLSPSYVYPDSLIEEYYVKIWGTRHPPKIITLTKKFTTTKAAGAELQQKLKSL